MKIAIGSDHNGLALKEALLQSVLHGHTVKDFGVFTSESVDYPDVAFTVAQAVASGEFERGILICGTGIGMSIAANKVRGIRAAACSDLYSAKMSRRDNNANILCVGGRVIGPGLAAEMVTIWLNEPFEGGRHQRRVDKIRAHEDRTLTQGDTI